MSQVVRTTNELIVNSLYLSGELGIGEIPDSFMLSTGLDLLNEVLDKLTADSIYIPFLTSLEGVFNPGQHTYVVSDMQPAGIHVDIFADRFVDLSFANYEVPGIGSANGTNNISFTYTANSVTNSLILSGTTNAFPTGTAVILSTTGTMPSPLVNGGTYYVIYISPNIIQVALSLSNALSNIPVVITTDGTPINTIATYQGAPVGATTSLIYPLRIISKEEYYGVIRQNTLMTRPGFIFMNKQDLYTEFTVYPAPDQPYPFKIQVKSMLNSLGNQSTLGELPPNYYGFLKYALGRKWLAYYPSANWPQTNEDEYQDYYNTFKNANETDMTIRPSVIFSAPEPFYWPNIISY